MGAGTSNSATGGATCSLSAAELAAAVDALNAGVQTTLHSAKYTAEDFIGLACQLRDLTVAAEILASGVAAKGTTTGVANAVVSGVVAVSSGLAASNYAEQMQGWARDAAFPLPKAVLLQTNAAAVAHVGPCYLALRHEEEQVVELRLSVAALPSHVDVVEKTSLKYQLAKAVERAAKAKAALDGAVGHLEKTRLESAAAIARGLVRDADAYDGAIHAMAATEPGVRDVLTAEAAELANTGPLTVGEEVAVVVEGRMQRAEVRHAVDEAAGRYELSLWTVVSMVGREYEAGFCTSEPRLQTVERREVYTSRKQKQRLSSAALALAAGRASKEAGGGGVAPSSMAFLALLYSDAERTLPMLHELGTFVQKTMPAVQPLVAPLKGEARAAYKTRDKYRGDYSRLTDLARMTLKCKTLADARQALRILGTLSEWELLIIKDRLMAAFDASATGGYRDMLLNLKYKATGHIVEVQITLDGLIQIKAGGGHASYQIARTHDLFEKETYRHEGALTPMLLASVGCGVVRELVCRGTTVGLTAHFDALLAALRAPSCVLSVLQLVGCDWPKGRAFSELANALPARGLKTLNVADMKVGGALSEALVDKCAEAEFLSLYGMALEGGIPASIGTLTKVHTLLLDSNRLSGTIPESLGCCVAMKYLQLFDNKLSGPVPQSLGRCVAIQKLTLYQNQLSGPVPESLSRCVAMQTLYLHQNQLSGTVPQSLASCTALKLLTLHDNANLIIADATKKAIERSTPGAQVFVTSNGR